MNLPQGVSAAVRITRADLAPEMRTTLQDRPSVPQTAAVVRDAQGASHCVLCVFVLPWTDFALLAHVDLTFPGRYPFTQ